MDKSVFKKRVLITGFILSIILFFFVLKLFNLHFSDKIILPAKEPIENGRGYIFDREGYLLALSIEFDSIYVNPQELKDPSAAASALSPLVNLPPSAFLSKFSGNKKFIWLIRRCDEQLATKIRALGIKGVYFTKEYKRVYPYNNLASNVIGFVGLDNSGLDGIEYQYNRILSGKDEVVKDEISREIYQKKNLTLTIDRYIQHVAEEELAKAMVQHRAVQGSVVILEVDTGRVLAIAKYPAFDPNSFSNYSSAVRANFSIVDTFEPGSTLKILALSSLLENKPEALKKEYFCEGFVDINDVRINCLHKHGKLTMDRVIAESCNAGMIQSVKILEKKDLYKTLHKFGLGAQTGLELPGEAEGILRPVAQWSGLSKYSISIGHELSVTSIQLVAAFNAIANGGVYVTPTLIEKIEKPDGTVVRNFYPRTKGRVIKAEDASFLMKMMREVVASGTGKRADSVYYQIAGKTGTSQKFSTAAGAYSDRNVSSFVGIAPYQNPKICMLAVIDDPEDRIMGGASAAPVLMRITDRILPYFGIGGKDVSSLRIKRSQEFNKFEYQSIPDLRGMNTSEAAAVLRVLGEKYGIKYFIKGSGRIYGQKPAPGSGIKPGENIILFMR
ncbi:MAG TPA: penicillin-binding transpeptidase domain-containing protein [Spirochaetota bacterium]|nr:penicillin-binding transpeptidase domain-containing protein [Spirochaetota bacterium]